jgi:hypothetical protein
VYQTRVTSSSCELITDKAATDRNFDIAISVVYILGIVTIGLWTGLKKDPMLKVPLQTNTSLRAKIEGLIGLALFAPILTASMVSPCTIGFRYWLAQWQFRVDGSICTHSAGFVFCAFLSKVEGGHPARFFGEKI